MNSFIHLTEIKNEHKEPIIISIPHISTIIPDHIYHSDLSSEIRGCIITMDNGLQYTIYEDIEDVLEQIVDRFNNTRI